jgi:hypothetical protein
MRRANDIFMLGHDRHDCPDSPGFLVIVARFARRPCSEWSWHLPNHVLGGLVAY